jgi:prepilin-type processing-associated H-X9-DG protein
MRAANGDLILPLPATPATVILRDDRVKLTGGIPDGTSNTLMIGENLPELNAWARAWVYGNFSISTCGLPLNLGVGDPVWLQRNLQNTWQVANGFRSLHPGGVNFALADGSVRFIRDSIDQRQYEYSCSRNGGTHSSLD